MIDKKQIQTIFLFKFKMGCKPAETTCNTNKAFGPGTAHEHTVRWRFKKFCKGDENLEDEEQSGRPSEVDDQLRAVTEADLFTTTREVAQELSVNHFMVGWHLKQIAKVKKLDKRVPHEEEGHSVVSDSLQPHGLYIQSMEFSRPEYWSR